MNLKKGVGINYCNNNYETRRRSSTCKPILIIAGYNTNTRKIYQDFIPAMSHFCVLVRKPLESYLKP